MDAEGLKLGGIGAFDILKELEEVEAISAIELASSSFWKSFLREPDMLNGELSPAPSALVSLATHR